MFISGDGPFHTAVKETLKIFEQIDETARTMSNHHLEPQRNPTGTLNKTGVLLVRMKEKIGNPLHQSIICVPMESACLGKFQQVYTPVEITEHSHLA